MAYIHNLKLVMQIWSTVNIMMWNDIFFNDFPSIQMKNPFTAGQSLPPPGIPGAYSVELVCYFSSNANFQFTQSNYDFDVKLWCFFLSSIHTDSPVLLDQTLHRSAHTLGKIVSKRRVVFMDFTIFFSLLLQPFPSHGFIKYSIPQPPGRQSVEVVSVFFFSLLRFETLLGLKTLCLHV